MLSKNVIKMNLWNEDVVLVVGTYLGCKHLMITIYATYVYIAGSNVTLWAWTFF